MGFNWEKYLSYFEELETRDIIALAIVFGFVINSFVSPSNMALKDVTLMTVGYYFGSKAVLDNPNK